MKQLIVLLCFPMILHGQIDSLGHFLEAQLDHESASPVHSIMLQVDRVGGDLLFQEAIGWKNREADSIQPTQQFRIASITKLFVATVVLQLIEEGRLKLTDKIGYHLSDHPFLKVRNLHTPESRNYGLEISVEHLLSHRTGLADIFTDKADEFFAKVFANPTQNYSPRKIVELYFDYDLPKAAQFKPGEGFYYSDMNYVVLGLLIEHLEGASLATVLRKRIINPLELQDTFLEFYEAPHTSPDLLHQWYDSFNMSRINTSFDWAGGGLVSSMSDLSIFISALFTGKLLQLKTLKRMTQMPPNSPNEDPYGLGIFGTTFNGDLYFGHFGFYGSYVGYCPKKKQVLVYNISQGNPPFRVKLVIEEALKRLDLD